MRGTTGCSEQQYHPAQKNVEEEDGIYRKELSFFLDIGSNEDRAGSYGPHESQAKEHEIDPEEGYGGEFQQSNNECRNSHGEDTISQDTDGLEKRNGPSQELSVDGDDSRSDPNKTKDSSEDQGRLFGGCPHGEEYR
mmetsp:Transcript_39570/g.55764  ORF Transcript_39570/g.55764 Transcript_39570/m.55764 type:complete len:137 (+) Transcript_39570:93-503(+)